MSNTLQIATPETEPFRQDPYLYKISYIYSNLNNGLYSEEFDPDFAPIPTSASELPELTSWSTKFALGVLEIWAGKRPPSQLAKWCHSSVYASLLNSTGYQREIGRLRRIYIHEPLDGLCESTATIRFGNRLRSMTMRFEGVDRRWICTNLDLI